jgi:glycosyltransferase EpsE
MYLTYLIPIFFNFKEKLLAAITVIMGVYNCETTLSEAIDSLLSQTFTDWQLVMCDDGSVDITASIAKEYANSNSNITFIFNDKNLGLAATLNHCLEYVNTPYTARMDGDDICSPVRFEQQLKFLKENPNYAVVSTAMHLFDENGVFGRVTPKLKPSKIDFIYGTPHCHAPMMMHTSVLQKIGGYDSSLKRAQDYDLWSRLYQLGYSGANLEEPLYSMRDDKSAISRRGIKVRLLEMKLRYVIFKRLNIPILYRVLILKPLAQALLPISLISKIRHYIYKV